MKAFIAVMLVLATFAGSAPEAPRNATKDTMRFKLHFAQGVLEGIATENFSLIATNAQKLKALSQSADWKSRSTREYQRLTSDFERAAGSLERSARNRNVDAATVAYFQLTTSCVTCHKYLRGADVGSFDKFDRGRRVAAK
jgi:cytochrome c556